MLNRQIICKWNGSTVLQGNATCAMAFDIAQAFLTDNFAGLEHKAWRTTAFIGKLDDILALCGKYAIRMEYNSPNDDRALVIITATE